MFSWKPASRNGLTFVTALISSIAWSLNFTPKVIDGSFWTMILSIVIKTNFGYMDSMHMPFSERVSCKSTDENYHLPWAHLLNWFATMGFRVCTIRWHRCLKYAPVCRAVPPPSSVGPQAVTTFCSYRFRPKFSVRGARDSLQNACIIVRG